MSWKVSKHVARHPAEYGAPAIGGAIVAVLAAFGIDAVKAAAISAMVMAVAPGLLTYARSKGWL